MSVPLDNLYHWVESLLPDPAVLYVFRPHGSKNISDVDMSRNYESLEKWKLPGILMHDQEPLDWKLYNDAEQYENYWEKILHGMPVPALEYISKFNLKSKLYGRTGFLYDHAILVHSEKNSKDLEKYQENGFVCLHYWAHAVIARDWYRFAEYDTRLHSDSTPKNKFLIYCRDWSHRREYRLKFLELLVQNNLNHSSQTSVKHTNTENVHFLQHEFQNLDYRLHTPDLIYQIPCNEYDSTASAGYEPKDFTNCAVSVVLETVFDDSRIHLTEKILRPIACAHPFILAAGPGSLEYLKSYGFKTFAPYIDESYDQETNGLKRLEKIINAMKQIQNLHDREYEDLIQEIKSIALFNQNHFFSDKFFDIVKDELVRNLDSALCQVAKTQGKTYLEYLSVLKKHQAIGLLELRAEKTQFLRQLRQADQDAQSSS